VLEPAGGQQRVLNGMLTILIDPSRLGDAAVFAQEMQGFLDWVKASPPQDGVDRVRVAGEPERETRATRLAEGIPVDENTWNELLATATKLGRDPEELNRLAGVTPA
jgi:uncharacterized oxidoreductase